MKKKGETFIAEDFELTEKTLAWLEKKYPSVDPVETLEKFKRSAEAGGWMYRNWQRAFEGIVQKGIDNGWRSIVTLKGGKEFDPKWQGVLHEARKHGFREPGEAESAGVYKTALELWLKQERRKNVVNFEDRKAQLEMVNEFQKRWGFKTNSI